MLLQCLSEVIDDYPSIFDWLGVGTAADVLIKSDGKSIAAHSLEKTYRECLAGRTVVQLLVL